MDMKMNKIIRRPLCDWERIEEDSDIVELKRNSDKKGNKNAECKRPKKQPIPN